MTGKTFLLRLINHDDAILTVFTLLCKLTLSMREVPYFNSNGIPYRHISHISVILRRKIF